MVARIDGLLKFFGLSVKIIKSPIFGSYPKVTMIIFAELADGFS